MSASIPPLRSIEDALRRITETLATELASPGTATPPWQPSEWLLARAVAAMHGVSPLLAGALRWDRPPEDWKGFLADQKVQTAARFERIHELLERLDTELRREGIPLVMLKGAALHALALYARGVRPMADVDLLAREQDMARTAQLLNGLGFRQTLTTTRHLMFEPLQRRAPAEVGECGANDIKIELHPRVFEPLPVDEIDITASVFPRDAQAGLNSYPSSAALMKHLLLHTAGVMTFRSVRLLHLNDISLVAARMNHSDWTEVLAGPGGSHEDQAWAWWMFPPLQLTARYFSCIPQWVLDKTEGLCPRNLARSGRTRTLFEVSYSNPWIEAFPGMEWARSAGAKLRYALHRIRPDPEVMATRAALLHSEPRNAHSEWARLSQLGRIFRWLTSSPPRVETLAAVRAVFEQSR